VPTPDVGFVNASETLDQLHPTRASAVDWPLIPWEASDGAEVADLAKKPLIESK
jgi:hypothetical protein